MIKFSLLLSAFLPFVSVAQRTLMPTEYEPVVCPTAPVTRSQ